MAELFQEARGRSHTFSEGAISPGSGLGYSPARSAHVPPASLFIGHFHKTPHAIASRRKFDYDEFRLCGKRVFFSF